VKVVRPERKPLERITTQPAHLEAYEKVEIHARIGGYLQTLGQVPSGAGKSRPLDIGDRVAGDQVLGELWVPEMEQDLEQKKVLVEQAEAVREASTALVAAAKARVAQARAEVGQYEASVAYRKSEYERYRQLLTERTVERKLVDERLMQYRSAESALAAAKAAIASAEANLKVEQARQSKAVADVKVARANLKQAEIMFDYRKVRAPFPGVIIRRTRMADTGAFVQSAATGKPTALFTLVRADEKTSLVKVRIVTDIPEPDTPWVKVGQQATLRIDALRGRPFAATVVRLAEALDPSTRTMRVELEPVRPSEGLRPGLYGNVTIILARIPEALLLPTSALLPSEGKPAVMIVKDGRALRREIQLGINDGIKMQVSSGLKGNEQVVSDGKDSLRDGDPVEVVR
jgi:RND family efflux transporter MFP subunit